MNVKACLLVSVLLAAIVCVTASGDIIYVDANAPGPTHDGSSWINAYQYLSEALYKPPSYGDEIWVAEGIYKPDESRNDPNGSGHWEMKFELVNGVAIYGGFPSGGGNWQDRDPDLYKTVLSGDLSDNDGPDFTNYSDNSRRIVEAVSTDANTVLDGFTIRGGNASGGGGTVGGGMYVRQGAPKVVNCTFRDNLAYDKGAGMYNNETETAIISCTFLSNRASDYGGGIYNNDHSDVKIIGCSFLGNSTGADPGENDGGGVYNSYSSPTLVNCLFSGNLAGDKGGGMGNFGGSPLLTNCTFSQNQAGGSGGGIYAMIPRVTNCIFWGNADYSGTNNEGSQISSSTPTINYSCVQGWTGSWGGTGNIGDDPNFTDPNGPDGVPGTPDDDLTLAGIACIDAGDNDAVPADEFDLDDDANTVESVPFDLAGSLRFMDANDVNDTGNGARPVVDMGAYEYGTGKCGDQLHPYPPVDYNFDCEVDFKDMAYFLNYWLVCTKPECD